eukprot:scaffold7897_cov248-Pinguiococcus_pyrenoidosus.AAC.2
MAWPAQRCFSLFLVSWWEILAAAAIRCPVNARFSQWLVPPASLTSLVRLGHAGRQGNPIGWLAVRALRGQRLAEVAARLLAGLLALLSTRSEQTGVRSLAVVAFKGLLRLSLGWASSSCSKVGHSRATSGALGAPDRRGTLVGSSRAGRDHLPGGSRGPRCAAQ